MISSKNSFSRQDRTDFLSKLGSEHYDLCIIGGGITGAGVARDAASRGMKVCVLEMSDFASGTSSRSSKLIHGGIRYLENLEFGLVFEALNERNLLFKIAPHLVHPLTFVLPVFQGSRVGMFKLGLGMWLYDSLALMHTPKFHERMSTKETKSRIPEIQEKDLKGSYLYSDAYMDDDRLVVETLRSANSFGAKAINYIKVGKGFFDEKGRLHSVEATDQLDSKKYVIRAKHFVSTVGPWTDQFASTLFTWKKILRPSKGVHLTFHKSKLPLKDAVVMMSDDEKRIVFAIPRHEMVIIGTTDTDYPGDPSQVHTEKSDVDYLLQVAGHYFPGAKLTADDIVASYAGVRPLVHDGSSTESKTSREHVILNTPQNVTFVAGGKYTTYRRMARDIVEHCLKNYFSIEEKVKFARNQTRDAINPLVTPEKLDEAKAAAPTLAKEFGMPFGDVKLLTERHGIEAIEILKASQRNKLNTVFQMEALFSMESTMCLSLRDFMLRRFPMFLSFEDHGMDQIDNIAKVFSEFYGWSDKQIQSEKEKYLEHIKLETDWKKSFS